MMPNKETGESGSGSSRQNGKRPADNENSEQQLMARENHHRHTPHQIHEMESFFQRCSHPDKKQRTEIGQDLGLDPEKVKYWFQNRRTQMKVNQDRNDNVMLKMEIDNLKNVILQLEETLKNRACPSCSSVQQHAHQLGLQNSWLKQENERFRAIASRFVVPSVPTTVPATSSLLPGEHIGDEDKPLAMFRASVFLGELRMMCEADQLLWNRGSDGKEVLNLAEYHNRTFSWEAIKNQHVRIEASRERTLVKMDSMALVERFCNAEKWMEMFPSIVSKAKTLQIVQGPTGNLNGSLNLMYAEMQMLSPLMPPREVYFIRYCQQDDDKSWGIVDFPLDSLLGCSPFPKCRRKPSGCIINEDMSRLDSSWVTWLEHVEVEDRQLHPIIDQFVRSSMAFGAHRWLAVLESQGERFSSLNKQNESDRGVPFLVVKSSLMSIAERTIRSFCESLSSSGGQPWRALSNTPEDIVRLSTRSATQRGHPIGLVLRAAATIRLPYSHLQVFDLLRDIRRRTQMLEDGPKGNSLQELAHIESGVSQHGINCISFFRIDHAMQGPSSSSPIYLLEESYSNKAESVVAYTTLNAGDVWKATSGDDPSSIPVLPSGFVVVPLNPTNSVTSECSTSTRSIQQEQGCLLTVGLQILAGTNPYNNLNLLSAVDVHRQVYRIIHKIKMALRGGSTSGSDAMGTGDRL